MAEPIPATNPAYFDKGEPQWFKMPAVMGLEAAQWRFGHGYDCGKRHTIEFIIRLAHEWLHGFGGGQTSQYGNFAKVLLGDIAPEGGAKSAKGKEMIRRGWHKSHNSGVDFDIFLIRKDGINQSTNIDDAANFDRGRTIELAKTIYRTARQGEIVRVFFDDRETINALRAQGATTIGPDPGRPANPETNTPAMPPTPHRDHFHVRLKGGTY